jgi:tetratricopeptide (TPR) repeat protein
MPGARRATSDAANIFDASARVRLMESDMSLSEKINNLFAAEQWAEARALIEKAMAKSGKDDHWLLARLATTYYEERKYKKALTLLEKARALAPACPLVLWDYAGALDALGRSEEAIKVYMDLIQRGPDKVGQDECGEGLKWAIGLLTDCFYRVSVCLKHLHRPQEAFLFLGWYAALVTAGASSMYADAHGPVIRHTLDVLREHPGIPHPRSPRKGLEVFSREAVQLLNAA